MKSSTKQELKRPFNVAKICLNESTHPIIYFPFIIGPKNIIRAKKSAKILLTLGLLSFPALSIANNSATSFPMEIPLRTQSSALNLGTQHNASVQTYSSGHSSAPMFRESYANTLRAESNDFNLPDLGSGGNRFIEANRYKALGEWSLQQLGRSAPILNDPWSQNQLESIAWQINAQARSQAPLALVIIDSPAINAFAIPGGVMGINTGTIIESESIDEVASVLAHEVAHLSQRHYEHRDEADRKAMLMQIGGVLAAIAASAIDGDAATAVMMGSQTAALNSQMAFSRSNEREADRIGMQIMAKAGFDPRAMPKFFATLNEKTQLNTSQQAFLPSFIMTHPLSSERLSEAQSRANSYPPVSLENQRSDLSFDLLKWRLKVLTNQVTETELVAASPNSQAAALALAYWYGTQGRYSSATSLLKQLKSLPAPTRFVDKESYAILATITEAEVAGMQGKWDEVKQLMEPYHNLYPERRDITLLLSDAWLKLGHYNQVLKTLKPLTQSRPHDIEALFLIQRSYELLAQQASAANSNSQTNQTANSGEMSNEVATIQALRYRAKGELWQGKYNDALVSLQQALTLIKGITPDDPNKRGSTMNTKPLFALVTKDIADVKTARDINR